MYPIKERRKKWIFKLLTKEKTKTQTQTSQFFYPLKIQPSQHKKLKNLLHTVWYHNVVTRHQLDHQHQFLT